MFKMFVLFILSYLAGACTFASGFSFNIGISNVYAVVGAILTTLYFIVYIVTHKI